MSEHPGGVAEVGAGRRKPEIARAQVLSKATGNRQLFEDAPAAVVDERDHERSAEVSRAAEPAQVMQETDVADEQHDRLGKNTGRARGSRDEPFNPARAPLIQHSHAAFAGPCVRVHVADRQAITDDQRTRIGQLFDQRAHGERLSQRTSSPELPFDAAPNAAVRLLETGEPRLALGRTGVRIRSARISESDGQCCRGTRHVAKHEL
jgi:hypothetical protein